MQLPALVCRTRIRPEIAERVRASLYRQRLRDLKKKEEARQRALARERLRVEAEAEQAVRDAEIDAAIARGTIPAATLAPTDGVFATPERCRVEPVLALPLGLDAPVELGHSFALQVRLTA